ncbi:MAG: Penicillin-binding protein 2 [Candidatus Anoxychlamydiales bacterium]|nr:Penicillin-binding protein 2 [Candidatus Anoxychlamydiales bacterium]NGX35489.1 Penicillin-binding protein 2 [Candidatus Anoxychlamydiales bacterium]
MMDNGIYKKISLISKLILIIFFVISFKIWHLGVIQKKTREIDVKKPQRRTIFEKANRGIICDRNDIPLAVNRIKYNATIYYSHIRELPFIKYEKTKDGKSTKRYIRKEYIKKLSTILANELDLEEKRVEDLIHSKASIFPHVPYVLKENISEEKYYRLKMLQRDYPGLHAEISSERFYPLKEIGSDLLGYMGKISQREYFEIAKELKTLNDIIEKYENRENFSSGKFKTIEDVKIRLSELKNLAYSANDLVGKASMEKILDEKLKGFHEKKTYLVDIKGNFLKELDGFKKPKCGSKINLTISTELQKLAENLLIEDEQIRDEKNKENLSLNSKKFHKEPRIKGGAIIAMDPNSGDILACASYPRFDPNDFINSSNLSIREQKQKNIHKWLETPHYIANIFDGKVKFSKEIFSNNKVLLDEKDLTYEFFLDLILPNKSPIKTSLDKIKDVKTAIELQENVEALLYFSKAEDVKTLFDAIFSKKIDDALKLNLKEHSIYIEPLQKRVVSLLSNVVDNLDKTFTLDLCRLFVYNLAFSDDLIEKVGNLTLSEYWDLSKAILRIKDKLKTEIKPIFHEIAFNKWREIHEKEFLQTKRKEEKENKRFARPYIDLLDSHENKKFDKFWQKNSSTFITYLLKENVYEVDLMNYFDFINEINKEDLQDDLLFVKKLLSNLDSSLTFSLLKTIRSFDKLDRPLLYNYPKLRKSSDIKLEKDLAASFYPLNSFGFTRSNVIANATAPGSIYKILIAYSALKQKYIDLKNHNLSLNNLNPHTMIDDIYWDSKIKKGGSLIVAKTLNGKPYPRSYKGGRLPKSAYGGIGKIDLIKAIEKSSNPYFAILAGDFIENPYNLINDAKDFGIGIKTEIDLLGEIAGNLPEDIVFNKTCLYSFSIGQHSLIVTPIQAAVMLSTIANCGKILKPKLIKSDKTQIKKTIFMPDEIRNMILEGMDRVVSSKEGSARGNIISKLRKNPKLLQEYKALAHQFVGKTSTTEFMHSSSISPSTKAQKHTNSWFATISFEEPKSNATKKQIWQKPELVVIAQLNFGSSGKEAAPLAFEIIKKYRQLKKNGEI